MNDPQNIQSLFQNAHGAGSLSQASLNCLDVYDLGVQIQAGLGIEVDDVMASEVVLVTIMPDDSASIRYSSNAQAVRGGHNAVLDALAGCPQQDQILIHNRYLNGLVLYPYGFLNQAVRMTPQNYDPNLGTPLYDQSLVLLGTVLAKAQEFSDNGVPVRTITLLITDGADAGSQRSTAADVKLVVEDMLRMENHTIAAMGIDGGGGSLDFQQVFRAMGIRDEWVLTPGQGEQEIRRAFQLFSQSALQVSQSARKLSGF